MHSNCNSCHTNCEKCCPYCGRSYRRTIAYNRYEKEIVDFGPNPLVLDIDSATGQNENFRTTLWTGSNLQLTVMSIKPGESIGTEVHPDIDQFLRIEEGSGITKLGYQKENLDYEAEVETDYAIIIPAGMWHNLINTGNVPLKLYSIYAPAEHPWNTIHETKEDAMEEEE